MSKDHFVIPIFIPHSGCPFQCIFCNQKTITGVTHVPSPSEVDDQIQQYLATIGSRAKSVLAGFYGGNFTGLDTPVQESYLAVAKKYLDNGLIQGIRISTRPDCIDTSILDHLKTRGVSQIELGIQSFDDDVLSLSKRGYTARQAWDASVLIREKGFLLGHQLMIGLPGDNWERLVKSAVTSVKLSPDMVRIYPTLVMEGTELAGLTGYTPLSLPEAIEKAGFLLELFDKHTIRLLRVGLHPPKDEKVIRAGPYHPSFKHLVMSNIWKQSFTRIFSDFSSISDARIAVASEDYDCACGYKNENTAFSGRKIEIEGVPWLAKDSIVLKMNNKSSYYNRTHIRDSYLAEIMQKYYDTTERS